MHSQNSLTRHVSISATDLLPLPIALDLSTSLLILPLLYTVTPHTHTLHTSPPHLAHLIAIAHPPVISSVNTMNVVRTAISGQLPACIYF